MRHETGRQFVLTALVMLKHKEDVFVMEEVGEQKLDVWGFPCGGL